MQLPRRSIWQPVIFNFSIQIGRPEQKKAPHCHFVIVSVTPTTEEGEEGVQRLLQGRGLQKCNFHQIDDVDCCCCYPSDMLLVGNFNRKESLAWLQG